MSAPEPTNTFLHDCKKVKDTIIALKTTHDEVGVKLKKQLKRLDGIIQCNGEILNNLEEPCTDTEKKKILDDILDKVKS